MPMLMQGRKLCFENAYAPSFLIGKYDNLKNPDLQTVGKNNVNQINWSLYLSDFGFSKTKLIIFSTFSR